MRHIVSILLALTACDTPDTAAELPGDAVAPPILMNLTYKHDVIRGRPLPFTLTGGPANGNVSLLGSVNTVAAGACPAAIAPNCLDVAPGFLVLATARTNAAGEATFTVNVPANLAATQVEFQAGSPNGANSYLSDSFILDVTDAPTTTTIPQVRSGAFATDTFVEVTGLVTAVRSNGFSLQAANTTQNGGIWIYSGTVQAEPAVGDVVRVAGGYTLFDNNGTLTSTLDTLTELDLVGTTGGHWTRINSAPMPTPIDLTTAEASNPQIAELYESMLVRVIDNAPLNVTTDIAAPGAFREFFVAPLGGAEAQIDNEFFDLGTGLGTLTVGDSFNSISGIMFFSFDEIKVAPRSTADVDGYVDAP